MLSKEEEALRRRAGRLLESLRRIPEVLLDRKAWENEHELVFSLFRRGTIDGANNDMLEAPIYNNRQIENGWLFLLEMRQRHPNRQKQIHACASVLGSSHNWSMVLHGSRKLLAALCNMPVDQAKAIVDAADAPEVLERIQATAATIAGAGSCSTNTPIGGPRTTCPRMPGGEPPGSSAVQAQAQPHVPTETQSPPETHGFAQSQALARSMPPGLKWPVPTHKDRPGAGRLNPFADQSAETGGSNSRGHSPCQPSAQKALAEIPRPLQGGGQHSSPARRITPELHGFAERPGRWQASSAGDRSASLSAQQPSHFQCMSAAPVASCRHHNPHNPFNASPQHASDGACKSQSYPSSPRRLAGFVEAAAPCVGRNVAGAPPINDARSLADAEAWASAQQGYGVGFCGNGVPREAMTVVRWPERT